MSPKLLCPYQRLLLDNQVIILMALAELLGPPDVESRRRIATVLAASLAKTMHTLNEIDKAAQKEKNDGT